MADRPAQPVDVATVEALTRAFAETIRQHYLARPASRDRVYEILNALAVAGSFVIAGAGSDAAEALDWFHVALRQQLADEHGILDRDATITSALREAMQHRITSSLQGYAVDLTFRDDSRAEQLLRNLNRLVIDDVAVTVMYDGIAGLHKTGSVHG